MRKKKKNPWNPEPPYSLIEHKLVNSEAFKNLKAHTKWLYVEFRVRYYGNNPRNIILTQREAKGIMAINTFYKARDQLIERGIIDVIKRGGLEKQPMIFGLSNRWKKYGTKDFVRVDIKNILPKIYDMKFKKGHKFMGNQFKKKEHL